MDKSCPFCSLSSERIIDSNELAWVIRDGFPVSTGHTLIIPKRHVDSWFDTSADERTALFTLLDQAKMTLDHEFNAMQTCCITHSDSNAKKRIYDPSVMAQYTS
jgi:diadenosine tetraphosphate (Ap4A) HIT family hydrolase